MLTDKFAFYRIFGLSDINIMKELKTEIIINAPRQKVWQALTNFVEYPAWNSFIISIEGLAAGGAILKTQMLLNGKKHRFAPVITKLKEGEQLEWLGKLPLNLFYGNHYFYLESLQPGQTRLLHGERFSGLLSGMLLKKIGEDTLRGFQGMNRALKQRAEELV